MESFSTVVRPELVEDLPSEAPAALVGASNAFGVDLWGRIRCQAGNLAVSPASISMALAMTWAGARRETADQLAGVLHLEGRKGVHEAAATLLHDWNDPGRTAYELRVVNRLFGEQSYDFEEEYLGLVRQRYGAPLERVDFQNAPEPSRARINAWIEAQTAERIRNLLLPGTVNDLTRLILTNAIYFLGKWVRPFHKNETHDAVFRTPGHSVRIPTMHQKDNFAYCGTRDLQSLQMPYMGGDFAMTTLLPRVVDGLVDLEKQISTEILDRWFAQLQQQSVEVALPTFTISPTALKLAPILAGMGAPLAFDRGAADFRGMADPPDPQDRLFVSNVVHKAFVKIDEAGTEASAATAIFTTGGAAFVEPPKPKQFRADHPFLFLIRDVGSGMILFIGRVTDPRA